MNTTGNILVISDVFYPDQMGGSGIFSHQLNQHLIQHGWNIDVVTRTNRKHKKEERVFGQNVYRTTTSQNIITYPLSLVKALLLLLKLVTKNKYEIIITHHAYLGVVGSLISATHGIPLLVIFHGPWHKEAMYKELGQESPKLKYALRRLVEKFYLKRASKIIVLSQYMRKEASEITPIDSSRFLVIPGTVDTRKFAEADDRTTLRRRLELPEHCPVLLCVRRLDRRMGIENLVDAAARLKDEGKAFLLLIGGKGDMEAQLKLKIKNLNLDNFVKLLGFIDEKDLPGLYAAADLVIMPSIGLEGFGLATIEALACGTPVIGSNIGGTPEILAPFNQELLFDDCRPETIAKKISAFFDSMEGTEIRKKARSYALNFDSEKVLPNINSLIHNIISSP